LRDHRRARPLAAPARLAALAALLGLWLAAPAARAERIGVVVAATVNTHQGEPERLASALGQALLEQLDIDVVAGVEAQRRLPSGGVPDTCVMDSVCQRDVAGRLDADQLLILAVVRVGERVQIDATWVHVATGRTASRARILVHDRGQPAAKVFAGAVLQLLPDAALRIGATAEAPRQDVAQPAARPSRRLTPGVWVAGGISAAALLAGGVFALDAVRRHRELDARGCAVVACPPADIDAVDTRARLADVLFGVGLVAGVTAGVLYWASAQDEPARAARLVPLDRDTYMDVTATRHGLAITWGGRF
jgi:hypothetical protein